MTQEHIKKIIEYVTIKESVTYKQLLNFGEVEKMNVETRRFYTGALEEWHAYSTILALLKDENQLDAMLKIWKD